MPNVHREIILSAHDIHKSYPMGHSDLQVLKGIDLDIRRNELLAVVGRSGAGKSTLLHILGGIDSPTSGTVMVDGTNLFSKGDIELSRFRNQKIGFVFQFHHLMPEFSALENTAMPGLIARQDRSIVYQRAEELLVEVGLQDRLQHKPGELSGGELQRVAVARSLINEPLLVLSDEPSGNLDLKNAQALHELMWKIVETKQKAFVIVTHNKDLAEEADRTIEIYDGRIKMA